MTDRHSARNWFSRRIDSQTAGEDAAGSAGGTDRRAADWDRPTCFGNGSARTADSGWSTVTPLHYTPSYEYPLIVWLHQSGHNERQVHQVLPHISIRNYLAVGVRGPRAVDLAGHGFDWPTGSGGFDAACGRVFAAIDEVCRQYSVHQRRIVLAGYRSGASMACRIALRHPQRFAGVVRLGGEFPDGGGCLSALEQLRHARLPMLWQQAINGRDDHPGRLQRDLVTAQLIRARVEVRQYRGDDVMNTVALRDIDRWCFERIISPRQDPSAAPESGILGDGELNAHDTTPLEFSRN